MTWMRPVIVGALIAAPTVLAFYSGGYFDGPRLWAGIAAWIAVAAAAVACQRPWPRTLPARLAVGGLAGLTVWTAVSITWAPLRDVAQADVQRLLLYLGVLVAGIAVFRSRAAARAVEPLLALGALVAVAEGLSERLLPGIFTLARTDSAPGRLFQPLTYWNAMGLLAAMGVVLCMRLAGDETRPRWMRACAAASTPTLAAGGYLTLSRGAIVAVVVGLTLLALLRPATRQLRAFVLLAAASVPAVVLGALLPGVRTLEGSSSAREAEGLTMLAGLLVVGLAAGAAVAREARRAPPVVFAETPIPAARRAAHAAAAVVAVGLVAVFVVLFGQRSDQVADPGKLAANSRLASSDSIRGDFWRVARGAFADEPLRGVGSGGFRVEWLRERTIAYAARDAHSLYVETPAELGLVGLALLAAFLAGIAACATRAYRRDPGLTAGPIAVVGVWAVHAGLDWDWEMPAVSLVALLLAAVLVAHGDEPKAPARAEAQSRGRAAEREPAGAEVAL